MTASADEQDLIRRAQAGDRTAFEALLNQYYDVIYRIAYKWSGVRADAEDITQNVCIKLARSIGLFGFRSAFLSWLYPLVINTAKDWARQQNAHVTVSDGEIDSGPTVAPEAEDRIYARQVLDYLGRLPEREREALYLVFGEGFTHKEVAVKMACKESTVSWYIHEARRKLLAFRSMGCGYG